MTTISTPDGRISAQQNELDTLSYINRFGWLRSRDLAALIWHDSKTTDSAIAMAQRTLKRIKNAGQILHRIAPDGATVYALSEAGVRHLGDERGIVARSGKDLIRELGNYEHRCHANTFAIHRINAGQQVWTEREIQANQAPIKVVNHKIPDGLVNITDPQQDINTSVLAWVEVERGYKKNADFNKMLNFIFNVLGGLDAQGLPNTLMFCAAVDIYIGEVIIQFISTAQGQRIINAVDHTKAVAPFDYGWSNILNNLYLCDLSGVLHPISKWID
jgi:hypothetical protein